MLATTQPHSPDALMPSGIIVVTWADPARPTRLHSSEVRVPSGYADEQEEEARAIIEAGNGEVIFRSFQWFTD